MSLQNPILQSLSNWLRRNFSHPGTVALFLTIFFGFFFIEFFGSFFLPVLVSLVLTYLLNSLVNTLLRWKFPHWISFLIVYFVFLALYIYLLFGLLPNLIKQSTNLLEEFPHAFTRSQVWISDLLHRYPKVFSDTLIQHASEFVKSQVIKVGQYAVHFSFSTLSNVIEMILYLVLVPLLVFFFLKDSRQIMDWFSHYMPQDRGLVLSVSAEVHEKIGCYIRGRIWEIIIIGVLSVVVFSLLDLQYARLLGFFVGVSVIIPYIGAIVVTIPVVVIALMEWGFSSHCLYLMIAYAAIVAIDANILVPLLFSETMDLHPVVIILSVFVFGGLWGFWGVFFAIPLATFFHAVLHAWPKKTS